MFETVHTYRLYAVLKFGYLARYACEVTLWYPPEHILISEKVGVIQDNAKPTEAEVRPDQKASTLDVDNLYPVFWSLQHSFSNPPRLFDDESFKQFKTALEETLAKFKEVPKVIQSGELVRQAEHTGPLDTSHDEFASAFNPKYLTSRDLFKLEVCIAAAAL